MNSSQMHRVVVLTPAFNEEESLPFVLAAIPKKIVQRVIVCNNGSTDRTAAVASKMGAIVVDAAVRGYGSACLAGINYLKSLPKEAQPEIVVFLDGDYSDYPDDMPDLVDPILNGDKDLVIGSRLLGDIK
ncbi:MAG: glycosyltransferase family 2 protein, partial [Saprospiraceae bacterium]